VRIWPWSRIHELQQENLRLRGDIAHQGQVINTLRRVLQFFGFEVNIDD
jgi:hypothetical protein